MKNVIFLLYCAVAVVLFTSCKKEEMKWPAEELEKIFKSPIPVMNNVTCNTQITSDEVIITIENATYKEKEEYKSKLLKAGWFFGCVNGVAITFLYKEGVSICLYYTSSFLRIFINKEDVVETFPTASELAKYNITELPMPSPTTYSAVARSKYEKGNDIVEMLSIYFRDISKEDATTYIQSLMESDLFEADESGWVINESKNTHEVIFRFANDIKRDGFFVFWTDSNMEIHRHSLFPRLYL